jgi:PAS domain S-box-containing protein
MREDQVPRDAVSVSEDAFPLAIDSFADHAFVTLDPDGIVMTWSVGAERIFGYARAVAVGEHVSTLFTSHDGGFGIRTADLQYVERQGSVSTQRWLVRKDGSRRCVSATVVALRQQGRCVGYAALAHEVPSPAREDGRSNTLSDSLAARVEDTSRRLLETNALLATEIADRTHAEAARIRLLRRLVVVQEEERRRLARDLHDDLGQRLTALRLTLEAIDANARDGRGVAEALAQALHMLARIDESVDFLAWELRPAALDELGLTKVLDTYVREWSRHTGIRATFHAGTHDIVRFAPELEASVYRIGQEALNNVAKHARAQSVNVLLEQRGETLVLVVEDDGVGIPLSGAGTTMMGLQSMRERATAVGGTVEIEPTPDGGITVLTRIPLCVPCAVELSEDVAATPGKPPTAVANPSSSTGAGDVNDVVVTSIRARLQELQHAVVARDEFIATVAHELRNPIAPLMFQLRLAMEKSEQMASSSEVVPIDWVQGQLRRVEQRLHRLLETLDRLLDVSRLSTGRIDLQPEPMDLAVAARDVIATLEAELAIARCPLTFFTQGSATGSWDRLRVEQICRNLLSNAIRFGAGRPIEVEVDADDQVARLRVRDHGVGIARDQQARIFERFERGVEQRSGGFGIGLWVVKNICIAMGGTISVVSEPGDGACFTAVLPRRRERESIDSRVEGDVGG